METNGSRPLSWHESLAASLRISRRRINQTILQSLGKAVPSNDEYYEAQCRRFYDVVEHINKVVQMMQEYRTVIAGYRRICASLGSEMLRMVDPEDLDRGLEKDAEVFSTFIAKIDHEVEMAGDGYRTADNAVADAIASLYKKLGPSAELKAKMELRDQLKLDYDGYLRKVQNLKAAKKIDPAKVLRNEAKLEDAHNRLWDTMDEIFMTFAFYEAQRDTIVSQELEIFRQAQADFFRRGVEATSYTLKGAKVDSTAVQKKTEQIFQAMKARYTSASSPGKQVSAHSKYNRSAAGFRSSALDLSSDEDGVSVPPDTAASTTSGQETATTKTNDAAPEREYSPSSSSTAHTCPDSSDKNMIPPSPSRPRSVPLAPPMPRVAAPTVPTAAGAVGSGGKASFPSVGSFRVHRNSLVGVKELKIPDTVVVEAEEEDRHIEDAQTSPTRVPASYSNKPSCMDAASPVSDGDGNRAKAWSRSSASVRPNNPRAAPQPTPPRSTRPTLFSTMDEELFRATGAALSSSSPATAAPLPSTSITLSSELSSAVSPSPSRAKILSQRTPRKAMPSPSPSRRSPSGFFRKVKAGLEDRCRRGTEQSSEAGDLDATSTPDLIASSVTAVSQPQSMRATPQDREVETPVPSAVPPPPSPQPQSTDAVQASAADPPSMPPPPPPPELPPRPQRTLSQDGARSKYSFAVPSTPPPPPPPTPPSASSALAPPHPPTCPPPAPPSASPCAFPSTSSCQSPASQLPGAATSGSRPPHFPPPTASHSAASPSPSRLLTRPQFAPPPPPVFQRGRSKVMGSAPLGGAHKKSVYQDNQTEEEGSGQEEQAQEGFWTEKARNPAEAPAPAEASIMQKFALEPHLEESSPEKSCSSRSRHPPKPAMAPPPPPPPPLPTSRPPFLPSASKRCFNPSTSGAGKIKSDKNNNNSNNNSDSNDGGFYSKREYFRAPDAVGPEM